MESAALRRNTAALEYTGRASTPTGCGWKPIQQARITHDDADNRSSDKGGDRHFDYDDTGRLWRVYEGGEVIATYHYNAHGRRTRKVTQSDITVNHYDLSGHLISETSASGGAKRGYVYLDDTPVAQIEAGGTDTLYHLHTDHLHTPRRVTNAAGKVVWNRDSDAFGASPAGEDPDNDRNSTTINLRFAGQYFDQETQLDYNYLRYYDPGIGSYVTGDAVGLNGGLNTYGYVGGKSTSLGRFAKTACNF
jgi:RHS repeat-associated protein